MTQMVITTFTVETLDVVVAKSFGYNLKKINKPGETIKKVFRYFPITNPNMYYFHNYFYLDYYGKTTLIYYV
jgi:hypothetical protein